MGGTNNRKNTIKTESSRKGNNDFIGTLGPAGTFSELATTIYNDSLKQIFFESISEAIFAVSSGKISKAILPLENSIQGTVLETLDGIFYEGLKIIDEVVLDIKQSIVGLKEDISVDEIEYIYSHPQAIAQCREYIKKHYPKAKTVLTSSTAEAFRKIRDEELSGALAIGPEFTAERYGLKILSKNIQDRKNNQTLFIVASQSAKEEKNLTSTILVVAPEDNRPGLLYDILGVFKEDNINLEKIESRPSREKLGKYIFYLRVGVPPTDGRIKKIMSSLIEYGKITNLSS